MAVERTLKLGINGAGNAGKMFWNAYKRFGALGERYNLVAIADAVPGKACDLLTKAGDDTDFVGLYEGPDCMVQMIERSNVDVVCICTPPYTHGNLARAAMEMGASPLVESPISTEYGDAVAVIEKALDCETPFLTNYEHRLDPPVVVLSQLLEGEDLGQMVRGFGVTAWSRSPEYYDVEWRRSLLKGGGIVVPNQLKHVYDLWNFLFGPPEWVQARKARRRVHAVVEGEDTALIKMSYPFKGSSFPVWLYCSTACKKERPEFIRLVGTKGHAKLVGTNSKVVEWPSRDYPLPPDDLIGDDTVAEGAEADPMGVSVAGHARMLMRLYEARMGGDHDLWLPHAVSSAATTRAMNAFYESVARDGEPVYWGEIGEDWKMPVERIQEAIDRNTSASQ